MVLTYFIKNEIELYEWSELRSFEMNVNFKYRRKCYVSTRIKIEKKGIEILIILLYNRIIYM
jgi:hypothetical protein